MNLTDFGQLVKTLRSMGVDQSGRRWTRESFSESIHLTPAQLGRLERGDRKYLDNQTLQLLVKSLNLTNLEQKEFLYAATGLNCNTDCCQGNPNDQFKELISLAENIQTPAFILDAYTDLVAVNKTILALYNLTPELIAYAKMLPVGFNFMHTVYSSALGFKEVVGEKLWREAANMAMLFFRRSTLRYRHTDYFSYIFTELLKEIQFDIDWYASHRHTDHCDISYEHFVYDHSSYGPLSYLATETIVNTVEGNLCLIVYNPTDSVTVSVFSELIKEYGNNVVMLSGWPEKKIIT